MNLQYVSVFICWVINKGHVYVFERKERSVLSSKASELCGEL